MQPENVSYSRFACIGAGLSGIGLGATLQRWYQIEDVHFFERLPQPGGTWWANKYPGCACDVPSLLYSFSFEQNSDWTRILPSQDELHQYILKVANKYNLVTKTTFSAKVEKCVWIEGRTRWRLTVRNLETGETYFHECQFLFSATGLLSTARELDVPGVENFVGPIIHSSQWREDVDLTGRKVVIFGNGCTAAQIIPNIVNQTKHLTQIARSKHWILPPIDKEVPRFLRWCLRNIPGVQSLIRTLIYLETERGYVVLTMTKAGARARQQFRKTAEEYMRKTAPKKYHDMLIPDFQFGCKRRIFDSGYLKSLHSDKLVLTNKRATKILPYGVELADGEVIDADVVILANGFDTSSFLCGIEVIGRAGKNLHDHWDNVGGPEAYHSTSISGFPNMFLLYGPNSGVGHTSAVIPLENSINYALRVIKPLLDGKATIVDVKPEAEDLWTQTIQKGSEETVFYSGCASWFVKTSEKGQKWNSTVYPFSQARFWKSSVFPVWKDFEFTGPVIQWPLSLQWLLISTAATAATSILLLGISLLYTEADRPSFLQAFLSSFSRSLGFFDGSRALKIANKFISFYWA